MSQLVSDIAAVIYTAFLLFGGGYTIKEAHDFVRYETLKQVSKPLSSSESLANSLTGDARLLKKKAFENLLKGTIDP